jgi:hypothetical protein
MLVWKERLDDIREYGVGSSLFDVNRSYKQNLQDVLNSKIVIDSASGLVHQHTQPFPRCMIHPESKFKYTWNLVVILLLLYTFIVMPYLIAFETVTMFSPMWFIDTLVDCLFLCDIVVNLSTAIEEDNRLIVSRRTIF